MLLRGTEPSHAPSDLSRITTEQLQEGMARRKLPSFKSALRDLEVFPGNGEECGEREFISTPPTLPRGRGILMLGGKTQGKSVPPEEVQKALVLMTVDLGMTFADRGVFPAPTSKEKLLPGRILQSRDRGDANWKGMIQVSKEKGGHTTKT